MEPADFLAQLRRRLRIPDAAADVWCPRCESVLDTHSWHASMYPAGGDRTRCHRTAHSLAAAWAGRAGLQPKVEKFDLLLTQCLACLGRVSHRTRPGHHWSQAFREPLPLARSRWRLPQPTLQVNTAQTCASQAIRFQPLVAGSTQGLAKLFVWLSPLRCVRVAAAICCSSEGAAGLCSALRSPCPARHC